MLNLSTEEAIEKEIELRLNAVNSIIETPEERRLQLKKIEYLENHVMNIHSKKHKRMNEEPPAEPEKTPAQEAQERQDLLDLIDSVNVDNPTNDAYAIMTKDNNHFYAAKFELTKEDAAKFMSLSLQPHKCNHCKREIKNDEMVIAISGTTGIVKIWCDKCQPFVQLENV